MQLRERTLAMLRSHLLDVRFMDEADADRMMEGFNRVLSRGAWTEADMKLVMGALRQTRWAMRRAAADGGGGPRSEAREAGQQVEERPVDG
jgi:tRNA C32,U32 (ribose-2'-O)-methylase TrmJ